MKLRLFLYTSYALIIFLIISSVIVPSLAILATNRKWHKTALKLHLIWAKSFFSIVMPVEVIGKEKLKSHDQYIFCANHFSYLDIPAFYLIYHAKFIGKSSLKKIPLFGYFFRKIHIPVTRESAKSRGMSLQQTKKAVEEGYSVSFFPEGGIVVGGDKLPYMNPFKDGAFKVAVEQNVPIVPVTMPYNFLILPDESPVRLHPHKCKLIIHDPIFPDDSGEEQIPKLKEQVFNTIQEELLRHHPEKINSLG
ncbi:MAG: 1-acyl-sn-glycerol-3-phosphate acyltransferase [Flammeovirgaceae bacterium]|nr:1-acyl-sn-glycerol-3-phosphate acyltransferase [Flammeovirgaceae bacterium]MBR06919.1 1-acyl-sn-glycerol-3-phosphate acyltransferase [Rickettsiales bacterium]HCX22815.1 1-acyl-sn-glycerol-3-phosphate acyltransferase [Cytophagales bacterium]